MKKRILLVALMAAMLVCVLAISISAAEPAYNDGEWIYAADGTTKLAIRDTDGNPLIWYLNGDQIKYVRADQTDETQDVYVKYKIEAGGNGFNTSQFNPQKCLKSIRIYDNGTEIICSSDNKDIQKALLFNFEKLDVDAFNGWLFGNKNGCCLQLRGIVLPSTLKGIGQEGFTNTRLVQIWNLENTQLFYLNACNFASASTLTQEATNGVLKLPQTLMRPLEVQGSQITTYIMNPNFVWAELNQQWNQYFRSCKKLQTIICPSQVNIGFGNEAFRDTPSQYIVFVTGTQTDAENLLANTNDSHNGGFKASKIISYETYLADQATYDNATNQAYIVYGYNYCDAFYDGEHTENDNPCVVYCDRCDDYDGQMKKNPAHNYVNSIAYTNYLAKGIKTQKCQSEGCVHNITPNTVEVNPIISSFKGFSTKEVGDGLTFGYTLNLEAIEEYEAVNSTTLEFGFVVAVQAFLGDNAPLDKDGNAASNNVIKASITSEDHTYTGADFRLTSASWDGTANINGVETALKDIKFYMAGYIIDGASVIYINDGATGNSADAYSYRDIAGTEVIPEETPAE